MTRPDDEERRTDEAWRSIVDNYGDRADLADETGPPPAEPPVAASPAVGPPRVEPVVEHVVEHDGERFVPPPPPPVPRPEPRRAVAWAGILVAPTIVLLLVVLGVGLPALLDYALVAWFVGGFVYLVATMPSGPRDPWDDGSRI